MRKTCVIVLITFLTAGFLAAYSNQGEPMKQEQPKNMISLEGYVTTQDGVRLFYRKVGSGPKVVIIPNGFYLFDDFKQFADGRALIFYDVRNRGWSDHVSDKSKLARGILQDVDDLDAVRRHFGISQIDLIGHSYMGMMVGLYAMKYPDHVHRVVQIGPAQPDLSKKYPERLTGADAVLTEVLSRLAQMQKEPRPEDPEEACKQFWSVLRVIFVTDPADAQKINWGRCGLPNERNSLRYWNETILPSIQNLKLSADEFAKVKAPVLTIHGTRDRSAPYGGGRDWALMLPDARLLTVKNAGHAPWIEAPEKVFGAIEAFLNGTWPVMAQKVTLPDLLDEPAN